MTQIFEIPGLVSLAGDGPVVPRLDEDGGDLSGEARGQGQSFDGLLDALEDPVPREDALPGATGVPSSEPIDPVAGVLEPGAARRDARLVVASEAVAVAPTKSDLQTRGDATPLRQPGEAGGGLPALSGVEPETPPKLRLVGVDPAETRHSPMPDANADWQRPGDPDQPTRAVLASATAPLADLPDTGDAARPKGAAPAPDVLQPGPSPSLLAAEPAPEMGIERETDVELPRGDGRSVEGLGRLAGSAGGALVSGVDAGADGVPGDPRQHVRPVVETGSGAPAPRTGEASPPAQVPATALPAPIAAPVAPAVQAPPDLSLNAGFVDGGDPQMLTTDRPQGPVATAAGGMDPPAMAAPGRAPAAPVSPQMMRILPQQISVQVARSDGPGGDLVLRLDPPELGQLRIVFTGFDAQVSAHVLADRADVAEQMRRNADVLEQAFRDAGFGDVDLAFGHHEQAGNGLEGGGNGDLQVVRGPAPDAAASGQNHAVVHVSDRLDIRV